MKMLRAAMFAGFCVAALAVSTANASTLFGFSDTIAQGEDKTYTVTLAPDLIVSIGTTPYIFIEAVAHDTTHYYEYPDGHGGVFIDRTVEPYLVTAVCAGKLDCHASDSSLSGYLIINVVTVGNIMKITAKNATHDFDNCSIANSLFCAGRTGPATFSASFRYEDPNADFTYTVQQNGVPEPATWGLMILGFGLVGAAHRRTAALARA